MIAGGETERAAAQVAEGMVVARSLSDSFLIVQVTETVLLGLRPPPSEELARVIAAFEELRSAFGFPLIVPDAEERLGAARAAIEERLDAASVARASEVGRSMSSVQLAEAVLSLLAADSQRPAQTSPDDEGRLRPREASGVVLSRREIEVLHLVGDGLSNRSIARRLAIGEATVKKHVAAARRKLGADNRAQAALLALRQGQLEMV